MNTSRKKKKRKREEGRMFESPIQSEIWRKKRKLEGYLYSPEGF